MGLLSLILSLELVFTASIIGLSSHLSVLHQTKHIISNVLGIQKIAQDKSGRSERPSPKAILSIRVDGHSALTNQIIDQFVQTLKAWQIIFRQYPLYLSVKS